MAWLDVESLSVNAENIRAFCETARNVTEKLNDEYFFIVPDNYDDDLFTVHLDKIIHQYHYIAFMAGILNNAMAHIEEETTAIIDRLSDYDDLIQPKGE